MTDKILVFIPAYNCENQIGRVLRQFEGLEGRFSEILVVDNRSPDNTAHAALTAAASLAIPVQVVRNHENYGLGGSHKAAFLYAAREGFDYCVVLHGDDQGNIRDLVPLLETGEHHRHDCLLGARFMPGSRLVGYSWFRTFGNRVFNALFSIGAGRRLYDLGSGLNLYRVGALKTGNWLGFANNLTFNYYMVLASVYWKWKLRFFPITWREEDQVSNVKLTRQSIQVLGILASYVFKRQSFLADNHSGRASTDYGFSEVGRNRND
ncbi:glycosyltransferase family 2 protein [Cupriavidus respiraculi]|nr:glycosyltransferase family 2 protein [Cupriavidus respiraculi]